MDEDYLMDERRDWDKYEKPSDPQPWEVAWDDSYRDWWELTKLRGIALGPNPRG